ncbi:DEAD/DEAH box helicase family protein [Kitasatospora sp. NPDC005751]|uniref:DEAD/DEAH box helicase family protein n=1 Tax=Kitasatospora sp. NPDC005751 TaxID=3157064 RepID=UPI0033F96F19
MVTPPAERRRFNSSERVAMYLAAGGNCTKCGTKLLPGWHGDHITPWSADGPTDVINGQALCRDCNLQKGSKRMAWTGPDLREWQRAALTTYVTRDARDFLVVATPGAGKTKFALRLASDLLESGQIQRVVIVVPSDHLKVQWAGAAHECGMAIDPTTKNGNGLENQTDYRGAAVTYAQVAAQPDLHRMGCNRRTLVILDEVHHAGDEKAWGAAVKHAFGEATRRLALSGTPFRSDNNPIPFVRYEKDSDGVPRSIADYTYGYGRAIRDKVCRQVDFHFYDGEMKWMDSGSVTSSANLSAELERGDVSAVLETALDPVTGWMKGLLIKADSTLTAMRVEAPRAGGLVIAYRAPQAKAYAKMLKAITGEEPVVVLSEDGPEAKLGIDRFSDGDQRWLVAVRMVSEGVDVPRLALGVYATKTKTEMFFRQAVGRFVRRQGKDDEQIAMVFAPALSGLRIMAAQIEQEIRHELELEDEEIERELSDGNGQQMLDLFARIPLAASQPTFHGAIHGGTEWTAEENERAEELLKKHDFPPSVLASMRKLVREELSELTKVGTVPMPIPAQGTQLAAGAADEPLHRKRKALADQLTKRSRHAVFKLGLEHMDVQWRVNQIMGVRKRADASVQQLQKGLEFVEQMLREAQ